MQSVESLNKQVKYPILLLFFYCFILFYFLLTEFFFDKDYLFKEYKPYLRSDAAITWTSMIHAFCSHGHFQEALNLFFEMTSVGIAPIESTYSLVLKILGEMTSLHQGQRIHAQLLVFD